MTIEYVSRWEPTHGLPPRANGGTTARHPLPIFHPITQIYSMPQITFSHRLPSRVPPPPQPFSASLEPLSLLLFFVVILGFTFQWQARWRALRNSEVFTYTVSSCPSPPLSPVLLCGLWVCGFSRLRFFFISLFRLIHHVLLVD